jgi:hypothetical protein
VVAILQGRQQVLHDRVTLNPMHDFALSPYAEI